MAPRVVRGWQLPCAHPLEPRERRADGQHMHRTLPTSLICAEFSPQCRVADPSAPASFPFSSI